MNTVQDAVNRGSKILIESGTSLDAVRNIARRDLREYRDRPDTFSQIFGNYDEFFDSWDGEDLSMFDFLKPTEEELREEIVNKHVERAFREYVRDLTEEEKDELLFDSMMKEWGVWNNTPDESINSLYHFYGYDCRDLVEDELEEALGR